MSTICQNYSHYEGDNGEQHKQGPCSMELMFKWEKKSMNKYKTKQVITERVMCLGNKHFQRK